MTASISPSTSDPPSPRYNRAGGRLCSKNPARLPTSSAQQAATNHCWAISVAARYRPAAISPTPAASPSMLSRKFIALVITTTQTRLTRNIADHPTTPPTTHPVPAAPGVGSARKLRTRMSQNSTSPAATATCTPSFSPGPSARRSS